MPIIFHSLVQEQNGPQRPDFPNVIAICVGGLD